MFNVLNMIVYVSKTSQTLTNIPSRLVAYSCDVQLLIQILRKIGRKGKFGGPGELFEPRLCQFDSEGTMLISDPKNENMQVGTATTT